MNALNDLWKETSTNGYRGEDSQFFSKDELTQINKEESQEKKDPERTVSEELWADEERKQEDEPESKADERQEDESKQELRKQEEVKLKTPAKKLDIKPEELKPEAPPPSYNDALNHYRTELILNEFKKVAQDGKYGEEAVRPDNLHGLLTALSRNNPHEYATLVQWANGQAQQYATQHAEQVIKPYITREQQRQVKAFMYRYQDLTPDLNDYMPRMRELANKYIEKFPEWKDNIALAIPLLYQKAKEEKLRAVSAQGSGKSRDLENGGARRPKAVTGSSTKDKDVDRIFDSKRTAPIDDIFRSFE